MSDVDERGIRDDALLDQVLAAVDRPALVCDAEGVVRAWNGALADLTAGPAADGSGGTAAREPAEGTTLAATPVAAVVDWDGDDPVERATASGEVASGTGRLAAGDRRYEVTARPLARDRVVGAVLTFDGADGDPADGTTSDESTGRADAENRERLATVLETLPVAMLVVDADGRIDHVQGLDFAALACDRADLVGANLALLADDYPSVVGGCRRALAGESTTETATVGERAYEAFFEPVEEDGAVTGAIAAAVDVTDREEREQRLRAVIESSPDPIAMQDTEGRYRVVNEAMVDVAGCDRATLRGATPHEMFDDETAGHVERHRRDVMETEAARVVEERFPTRAGERVVRLTVAPHRGPDGTVEGTVSIARDVTELERQHAELERLTAIQELVQESVRALTGAATREEIAETVCERLAESSFYEAAWIGSRDPSTSEVTPDHAAGDICEYLASVTVTADAGEHGRGPGGRAYRSGEVQVVDDVREDPTFEPWRETALEHGLEGLAVVPLTHGSTTHGILAVYTDRPDAFGEREVAGFETLGEAVGFAMSATQHRRLLEADSVLELEFAVTSDGPFIAATEEHDCRFVFDDAVLGRDGQVIDYLTVEGADPEVGAEIARGFDNFESMRRLDGPEGPHFEMHWRESVFQYLAEAGARGLRGVIEDGTGTMVVEAPGDIDVRQVTDAMLTRFPEVELVAKRERETSDAAWWRAHGDIGATLTDRQRAVLQAAYYSGYYEWPRETDAETLADAMDVASTTLLQHLRKGHGRVLEALFES